MKGKAQEGKSIEQSEVEDNKNNSVKEKNIMFGARKCNADRWQRKSNYLIAALFLLLFFFFNKGTGSQSGRWAT